MGRGDGAVVCGHEFGDDGETDTATAGLVSVRTPPEPFEDVREVIVRDAWAFANRAPE